jgi:hypothetical protein
LTTQAEDGTIIFLQDKATETLCNGFVTRDKQLNWSDLTAISQDKLLQKRVEFRGARIYLNELMPDGSPAAKLSAPFCFTGRKGTYDC